MLSALHGERAGEGGEVSGVGGLEREVGGIQTEGGESRVVHRRRSRVADRLAGDAVKRGVGTEAPELQVVEHAVQRQLTRCDASPGEGPTIAQPRRERPSGNARRAHPQNHMPLCVRFAEIEERDRVAQPIDRDRQLRDLGAEAAQVPIGSGHLARRRLELMVRDDDPAAPAGGDERRRERGGGLDVDVLGAGADRTLEDPAALLLAPREAAAFPRGAAGDDHRPAARGQGGLDIRPVGVIEPHLDEVGAVGKGLVAGLAQRGHRRGGSGHTQERVHLVDARRNEKSLLSRRAGRLPWNRPASVQASLGAPQLTHTTTNRTMTSRGGRQTRG